MVSSFTGYSRSIFHFFFPLLLIRQLTSHSMFRLISVLYRQGSFLLMKFVFLARFLSKRLDKKGWICSLGATFSPSVVLKNKKFQTQTINSSCHFKDSHKEAGQAWIYIGLTMMNETADSSNPLQSQLQLEKPFLTKAEHFSPLLLGKKNIINHLADFGCRFWEGRGPWRSPGSQHLRPSGQIQHVALGVCVYVLGVTANKYQFILISFQWVSNATQHDNIFLLASQQEICKNPWTPAHPQNTDVHSFLWARSQAASAVQILTQSQFPKQHQQFFFLHYKLDFYAFFPSAP